MDPSKFYIIDNGTTLRLDKGFYIGVLRGST